MGLRVYDSGFRCLWNRREMQEQLQTGARVATRPGSSASCTKRCMAKAGLNCTSTQLSRQPSSWGAYQVIRGSQDVSVWVLVHKGHRVLQPADQHA